MAEVRLTKNELRDQQKRLGQLERYLPTLQLKKAMLQVEVNKIQEEILHLEEQLQKHKLQAEQSASLLSQELSIQPESLTQIFEVRKEYENLAGVEVPRFIELLFAPLVYNLFETPPWLDNMVEKLRAIATGRAHIEVINEKLEAIERELREVSIRVNLFERILIPRAKRTIKKISVFLGDQDLAAVGRAKVAKTKIENSRANQRELHAR